MRSRNDVPIGMFDFFTMQTAGSDSSVTVSWDDGELHSLAINLVSGEMTVSTTFNVEVNGVATEEVFSLPPGTKPGSVTTLGALKAVPVVMGDRILVKSGGEESSNVLVAKGQLVLRR